jgi:catechol 2,3-dioxygenase-like lactoylglutathione lyase family enzyme
MADERTYPCLPCADIDEAIAFYGALGFEPTYRQLRPNPYAVVRREDLHVHLFGIDGFKPEDSYGTVIVTVPDSDALYEAFALGLRQAYGRLPVKGIPRITRPRKKYGTVRGFSVVDVGGNWLRISRTGDTEDESEESEGLAGALAVATRLGDAHGDEAKALRALESGLRRYADATAVERARALLYRAELAVRLGRQELAEASLAEVRSMDVQSMDLDAADAAALADDLAHATELVEAER